MVERRIAVVEPKEPEFRRFKVSAPGKLMLFGEHAVVYGRPCLITAVDQRMEVSVQPKPNDLIEIGAPGVGITGFKMELDRLNESVETPAGARFLIASLRNFSKKFGLSSGLKIETKSEFSSEFGFGSSSAVTVGILKALAEFSEIKLDDRQLFDLSYQTVRDVQGVGSGFDLAAAIFGGTIYFVTGGKEINSLDIGELPLVVGYSGIKADTSILVRQVADFRQQNFAEAEAVFDQMTFLTQEARRFLEKRDWEKAGQLMDTNQNLLELLGVSTRKLSVLIESARKAGAYGAKLSGAGGGDCMITLVSEEKRGEVEKAIGDAGGKVLKVKTNARGVKIE